MHTYICFICMYVWIYAHIYIHECLYTYVYMFTSIFVCICAYTYVCTYVHFLYMDSICVSVCMFLYILYCLFILVCVLIIQYFLYISLYILNHFWRYLPSSLCTLLHTRVIKKKKKDLFSYHDRFPGLSNLLSTMFFFLDAVIAKFKFFLVDFCLYCSFFTFSCNYFKYIN